MYIMETSYITLQTLNGLSINEIPLYSIHLWYNSIADSGILILITALKGIDDSMEVDFLNVYLNYIRTCDNQ